MSTHYHAAQSKGFPFSDYEVQVQQWHDTFRSFSPESIAEKLGLTVDGPYLYLHYIQQAYRLDCRTGSLEKQSFDGTWHDGLFFNEAMSIYHHLHYTAEHPRPASGVWVPSADLEGLSTRSNQGPDPLLDPFALTFTGRCRELVEACEACGGEKLNRGDVSYQFTTFPQIPLQMIFWDADEDFPAQVQILADKNAVDYMHRETIGCIVADLLQMLEETAAIRADRMLELRPHHGMCMAYFQGKGYSPEFTDHMAAMIARMETENPPVRLVVHGDCICSHCPFNHDGICETAEKVASYDRKVLEMCHLQEGRVLPAKEFRRRAAEEILNPGLRRSICGNCKWNELCR